MPHTLRITAVTAILGEGQGGREGKRQKRLKRAVICSSQIAYLLVISRYNSKLIKLKGNQNGRYSYPVRRKEA